MAMPDRERACEASFATVEEKPIWLELFENFRDCLFPQKLPPLQLTSTPIPVPDRMASNTNPWAVGTATLINSAILALLLLMGVRAVVFSDPVSKSNSKFHIDDFPLFAPPSSHGGRGGGTNDLIDPNKGHLPRIDRDAVEKLQVPLLDHPKLALDNSMALPLDLKLPENQELPMIGVHSSTNVTVVSGGPGKNGGIGYGPDGGYGPGSGPGWGPGSGQGIYSPGIGGVSQLVPILTPEAEFSDEARRQKYQGACAISLIVDAQGNPQNLRVIQPLGLGLDEKALEAVHKYRFKPARKDGKPVAVRMSVVVNFRLF